MKTVYIGLICFLAGGLAGWIAQSGKVGEKPGALIIDGKAPRAATKETEALNAGSGPKLSLREADLPEVLASLRRLNMPPEVLYVVATSALRKEYSAKFQQARFTGEPKRWQLRISRPNEDQRNEAQKVVEEVTAKVKALLGDDYSIAKYVGSLDPRVAGLAGLDKWARAEEIRIDYQTAMFGKQLSAESKAELEKAFNRDLSEILSPEELADYQAYNSNTALELQTRLIGADIDDETYAGAYKAYAELVHSRGQRSLNVSVYEDRLAELEAFKDLLPMNALSSLSKNSDKTFREVSDVFSAAKQSDEVIVDKYKEWLKFHDAIAAIDIAQRPRNIADVEKKAAAQQTYSKLSAGLEGKALSDFNSTRTGAYLIRLMGAPGP